MSGENFKVSTVMSPPFIMKQFDSSAPDKVSYHGFLVDVLDKISQAENFTYQIVEPKKKFYGADGPHGWNGVMGDIVNKRADIGAPLTVTKAREEAVDFSKPFLSDGVNLLVKKPSWFDLGLGYLVRPLSSDFWIMLLVVLLLIGLVFFLIGKFSPYEWGNVAADKDPRGAKNSFTLRNSYLFALTTLSWQGFREAPKSLSGRIMAAFWMMFVLFTLIAYSANLTAYFLSRPEQIPKLPFKTYEELLNSDITPMANDFSSTASFLRKSHSKTLSDLWSKMDNTGALLTSSEEGAERVKSQGKDYAMFMETRKAQYIAMNDDECELLVYGETLFHSTHAFAVEKGSPIKELLSEQVENLRSSGVLEEMINKYWKFGGRCSNYDGRHFVDGGDFMSSLPVYPVTLKDMAVAILLLFLGFIASMVFLVVENVHYAVTKQGKKIEKPKILSKIERPKIFKGKGESAKPAPSSIEEGVDVEAGPSSDGLEDVPLDGIGDSQEPGPSDELLPEEKAEEKA